jgi:hypothetical protein
MDVTLIMAVLIALTIRKKTTELFLDWWRG